MKSILILSFIVIGCHNVQNETKTIQIDMEAAVPGIAEKVFSKISYVTIKLPDSVYFGDIEHIKSSGKYLFLHDLYQTQSITIIDTLGNYINQLKRKGRGPGEYMDIESFAYDKDNKELVINDRVSKQFQFYSFPDLEHVLTKRKNQYLNTFEVLDASHWLVISDEDNEQMEYAGVEIWDENLNLKSKLDFMNNSILSIDLSYSNTITSFEDYFLYANPDENTMIYKIDSQNQTPIYSIDFGENKIPKEVFTNTKELLEAEYIFGESPNKAFWVQNVIENENDLLFWAVYVVEQEPLYYQIVYDKIKNEVIVYSELKFNNTDISLPVPDGVVDGNYISSVYTDEIESRFIQNKKLKIAIEENENRETPILLIYRL
ncbi:MAG: 6-bladed beta-propeller [Flavobacteriaceae bacterium]|nr:6-bladed beta-propeller [Flavobacteriaceae bacterium]MCY4266343.1 6-bladed beta-propeller [Flavobacteriaceae bacterium]MCY4299307.1 6-bladed beta-propeller [Flavobacteriaceae bacterium]